MTWFECWACRCMLKENEFNLCTKCTNEKNQLPRIFTIYVDDRNPVFRFLTLDKAMNCYNYISNRAIEGTCVRVIDSDSGLVCATRVGNKGPGLELV
jgi:hypothetical protein